MSEEPQVVVKKKREPTEAQKRYYESLRGKGGPGLPKGYEKKSRVHRDIIWAYQNLGLAEEEAKRKAPTTSAYHWWKRAQKEWGKFIEVVLKIEERDRQMREKARRLKEAKEKVDPTGLLVEQLLMEYRVAGQR